MLLLSAVLTGFIVGAMINALVCHLPSVIEREFNEACEQYLAERSGLAYVQPMSTGANMTRGLHCQHCGHIYKWHEQIPVVSWFMMGARCPGCETKRSMRHPLVELITAVVFVVCVVRFDNQMLALTWCAFWAVMLALALIDYDTMLLPDVLTKPLTWAGITLASIGYSTVTLQEAVIGAVAGFGVLMTIAAAYKRFKGKVGLGGGDVSLMAAIGAWLGWPALYPVLVIAALLGLVYVLLLPAGQRNNPFAFGPMLISATFIVWSVAPMAPSLLMARF